MNALANGFSHPDSFARFAPAEWGGTPHTSTLAKARASVKNSRAGCCASANGAFCGAKCFESTLALLGRTRMPVGVRKMSAAEPLGAPLAILLGAMVAGFIQPRNSLTKLFLWFCGCCVHRILRGIKRRREEALSGPVLPLRLCSRRCRQYTPARRPSPPCGARCLLPTGSPRGRIVPFQD